ncbi:hypothetical protein IAU60_005677 [Kwoniella sp. DSM 27419]
MESASSNVTGIVDTSLTSPARKRVKLEADDNPRVLEDGTPATDGRANRQINKYNQPYQSTDTDVTLVSADGLHFDVHSYQLMAASSAFRNLISLDDGEVFPFVEFDDDEIEHGPTIAMFLGICHGLAPSIVKPAHYNRVRKLIRFLYKYDCQNALSQVRMGVRTWLPGQNPHAKQVFHLAMKLDDADLAADALRYMKEACYMDSSEARAEHAQHPHISRIPGASVVDLSAMDRKSFTGIPEDYKFALLRAARENHDLQNPAGMDWKRYAKDFEAVMGAIRQTKNT